MRKKIISAIIVLAAFCCLTAGAQEVGEIDLSKVPDGVYKGKCTYYGFFTCEVEVKVSDHRITAIEVFEDRDSGYEYVEMAKGVTRNVIREQSLKVDTITGATITSRAILKAIENALAEKKR